ncbi:MAG: site-specific integrase [Polyangiaceae bacterium]|nr:site-specific integrase [Polyangiaceae bacterium]
MAIRRSCRRGEPCLFIDIRYTAKDGRSIRFRKDAQVQTMAAAKAEEKRYLINIAQYGSPYEPIATNETANSIAADDAKSFADVVDEFRQTFMVARLKITSRKGYDAVLMGRLVPRFGSLPITRVDARAAEELDLELVKRKLKLSTRNNVQIVLRSVLRFAAKRGYIPAVPVNMPSLKQTGQSVLEIPSDEQVAVLLAHARESHRCAFTLMSDAGLRPNEVRALRRRDVQLRYENGEPVGGFVTIRQGWSHGETHTPKTGQREVPISPELAQVLAPEMHGDRDGHVAVTHRGTPWGQHGLAQAFERVMKSAGLKGWSVYCLRHYAITSWLRAGIPVHVVQRMAGHVHLSTTQRYVHFLKADLEDAARKIAARGRGAMRATEVFAGSMQSTR